MRNILGCLAVALLIFLGLGVLNFVIGLLFSNPVTAVLTMFGFVGGGCVLLYALVVTSINENHKD
jgi:hypothetical protein